MLAEWVLSGERRRPMQPGDWSRSKGANILGIYPSDRAHRNGAGYVTWRGHGSWMFSESLGRLPPRTPPTLPLNDIHYIRDLDDPGVPVLSEAVKILIAGHDVF